MYHIFFIHSSADGHLGCFRSGNLKKNFIKKFFFFLVWLFQEVPSFWPVGTWRSVRRQPRRFEGRPLITTSTPGTWTWPPLSPSESLQRRSLKVRGMTLASWGEDLGGQAVRRELYQAGPRARYWSPPVFVRPLGKDFTFFSLLTFSRLHGGKQIKRITFHDT